MSLAPPEVAGPKSTIRQLQAITEPTIPSDVAADEFRERVGTDHCRSADDPTESQLQQPPRRARVASMQARRR